MKKVIISRPRKSGISHPVRKKININDLNEDGDIDDCYPRKISAKKDTVGPKGWEKNQTDLLGPMRRYLQKQVGRNWNEIWSEICEDNQDFMGDHLKGHIQREVVTNCYFDENGRIINKENQKEVGYYSSSLFFVHPETGLLEQATYKPYKRHYPELNIYKIDDQEYHKHEDIWYRVVTDGYEKYWKTRKLPHRRLTCWVEGEDVFGHGNTFGVHPHNDLFRSYGMPVVCIWKQQANSRECKILNEMEAEGVFVRNRSK